MTTGHQLWHDFLEKNDLTDVVAAREIQCSRGLLSQIKKGQRPGPMLRAAIARWTRGHVPERAWFTDEELAQIAAVVPFRRPRRAAVARAQASRPAA